MLQDEWFKGSHIEKFINLFNCRKGDEPFAQAASCAKDG